MFSLDVVSAILLEREWGHIAVWGARRRRITLVQQLLLIQWIKHVWYRCDCLMCLLWVQLHQLLVPLFYLGIIGREAWEYLRTRVGAILHIIIEQLPMTLAIYITQTFFVYFFLSDYQIFRLGCVFLCADYIQICVIDRGVIGKDSRSLFAEKALLASHVIKFVYAWLLLGLHFLLVFGL